MAKARSAITGRYVRPGTAGRHPRTTVTISGTGASKGGSRSRSAISGRFVKPSTARRNPGTTINENS